LKPRSNMGRGSLTLRRRSRENSSPNRGDDLQRELARDDEQRLSPTWLIDRQHDRALRRLYCPRQNAWLSWFLATIVLLSTGASPRRSHNSVMTIWGLPRLGTKSSQTLSGGGSRIQTSGSARIGFGFRDLALRLGHPNPAAASHLVFRCSRFHLGPYQGAQERAAIREGYSVLFVTAQGDARHDVTQRSIG